MSLKSERTHPGVIADNSPTFQLFQRWGRDCRVSQVPKGRLTRPRFSAVPSGLNFCLSRFPNVETLGYFHVSLREKNLEPLTHPSSLAII
jgi:hypothetical protein